MLFSKHIQQKDLESWKEYIPNIESALKSLQGRNIMSVGITPFSRIVPSFFIANHNIFVTHRSADSELLKKDFNIYVFEDKQEKIAKKVKGTNYLVGNYAFQNFLKTRRDKPTLLFLNLNDKTIDALNKLDYKWVGNYPETFQDVQTKNAFKKVLDNLDIVGVPKETLERENLLNTNLKDLQERLAQKIVIQRGDKEVGGNVGTLFISNEEEFSNAKEILMNDEGWTNVVVSPFVKGHSVSMLGCATKNGILTGPLQLQFIDVPEALHGIKSTGSFNGNDLAFKDWNSEIEIRAQKVVEKLGEHLYKNGYKGIFGIDFIFDKEANTIYPLECNPRFTGSVLIYSLSLLDEGKLPLEFFHLAEHLDIELEYDFEKVNKVLKIKKNISHISISPKGIFKMNSGLVPGVYSYDEEKKELIFVKPGYKLSDLDGKNKFLIIDTIPAKGADVAQEVPGMFKLVFPYSIAKSSHEVEGRVAFLLNKFSKYLLSVQDKE